MDPRLQRLTPQENTLVGTITGLVDVSLTQWILYCKNSTQQRVPLTLNPRIMYRGYVMSCANMGILTGVQFPLTGLVTNLITGGKERRLTDTEQIQAAAIGGYVSGTICAPLELLMIQQQRFGTSLLGTPAKVLEEGGFRGLFRGLNVTCLREAVFTGGLLGLGPVLERACREKLELPIAQAKLAAAVGSGLIVGTVSHPLDTIKTCQQGDVLGTVYGNGPATGRQLYAEAGLRRFFSGWTWRTGRMMLQVWLWGECKERLSPLLFPHHFQD